MYVYKKNIKQLQYQYQKTSNNHGGKKKDGQIQHQKTMGKNFLISSAAFEETGGPRWPAWTCQTSTGRRGHRGRLRLEGGDRWRGVPTGKRVATGSKICPFYLWIHLENYSYEMF